MPASSTDDAATGWLYGGAFVALIGGAWVTLGWLGASPWAPYLSHAAGESLAPLTVRVGLFVVGWTVMSVAMMLPSSLPLITVFRTITRGAPRNTALVTLLAAGYLATWALFGAVAWLADAALHQLVEASPLLGARAPMIPAGLLLAAGLFQFSPLKYACLTECRSPVGFVIRHWPGGSRALQAFRLGVRHGLYCVGCCWVLMLLMFAVGGIQLGWMLALGAVMFVEKAVAWGRWVTAPVGAVLALWGLALLARVPGVPVPF
jgi:predicted metal-binding membrane protein